jgi:hypothetical protein
MFAPQSAMDDWCGFWKTGARHPKASRRQMRPAQRAFVDFFRVPG